MMKKRPFWGGNIHDRYDCAHAYRVPPPPPVHEYRRRVHFEDDIVNLSEDRPHGTTFFEIKILAKVTTRRFLIPLRPPTALKKAVMMGLRKTPRGSQQWTSLASSLKRKRRISQNILGQLF